MLEGEGQLPIRVPAWRNWQEKMQSEMSIKDITNSWKKKEAITAFRQNEHHVCWWYYVMNCKNHQCLIFNSHLYYPRCVIHESSDNVLNLGLSLPAGGQSSQFCWCSHVSLSQLGTRQWNWGEKGRWMPTITTAACKGLWASPITFMYSIFWHHFLVVKFKLICHGN